MRIKIVFIVIVVFVLIFFFRNDNDEKISNQEIVKETITKKPLVKNDSIPKLIIKEQPVALKTKAISEHSKYEEPIDIIYRELSAERYSSEPALELGSVMKEILDCGYVKSYKRYKFIEKISQLSKIQQKTYLNYQDNCREIKDTYPSIVEYNQSRSSKQDFLWILMNSPYRELAIKSKNLKKLDPNEQEPIIFELTRTIIKTKNAQMLLFLSTVLTDESLFLNALKLPQVLSTVNTDYVQMIIGQATVLMSCQYNNGITCAPSSHTMTVICFEDERACGMDVGSWFKYNHTFSHNQDIYKVIAYFKTL